MVMKMNKSKFIDKIAEELECSLEKATVINSCLEDNFFISKKSKDIIIADLIKKLDISLEEATNIYEVSTKIAKTALKDTLKHPFRNKD